MGNDLNANEDDPHHAKGNDGRRNSPEECQQLCQEVQECNFFTYTPTDQACYLKTSSSGKRKHTYATSGPRICQKGYYIKTFVYYYEGLYARIALMI